MDKWSPLRPLRSPNQRHLRFLRQPVALAGITFDAGTDDILPSRRSTAVTRDHVIKVEVAPLKKLAAVLARILVPLENIVPGEFYFFLRQTIEKQQHDHARDPNLPRNRRHQFVVGRSRGDIAPAFEIVSQEIIRLVGGNDMGVSGVDEGKCAPGGADIHRLPEAIENENLTVKQCIQAG